jgi:hypothetical protein
MKMIIKMKPLLLLLFIMACTTQVSPTKKRDAQAESKEFSASEIIISHTLIEKIFDKQMPPLACIEDVSEAELFLRTLTPRMEMVEDEIMATFDEPKRVEEILKTCEKECTCSFIMDLLKENEVSLSKKIKNDLSPVKLEKQLNKCLSFYSTSFCQSEIYQQLEIEKDEFNYESNP